MFKYCPACASPRITFERERVFRCPDCGFTYYHSVSAASGLLITTGEGILFLVRGKEPAIGKLDLPGGFVSKGEGIVDGLRRECIEEIGWDPGENCTLFSSFANIYPYKGIVYNTCDIFFTVKAHNLKAEDLALEKSEIAGVKFIPKEKINFDDLAFESTKKAVKAFLTSFRE